MSIVKKILIPFAYIFLWTACFGQQGRIDSLKKVLPVLRDSARIDCLNALSETYAYMQEPSDGHDIWYHPIARPDSATYFARRALEQAEKLNYVKGRAKAYYNLGRIDIDQLDNDFRIAESYFRRALEYSLQVHDDDILGRVYARLGEALWYQSEFPEAIESFEKAEQLFQKTGDKNRLGVIYLMMSATESQRGFYEKSLQYGLEGQHVRGEKDLYELGNLYQALGDYETALILYRKNILGNCLWIGETFIAQKRFDSAMYYYRYFEKILAGQTKTMRNKFYSHLGELYFSLGKYDTALAYLNKALTWQTKMNDGNEIMWTLLRLARTYTAKKNYEMGEASTRELMNRAQESGARQYLPEAHLLLYNIFERLHGQDSAYFHLRQYTITKEVLDKDLSAQKLAFYKTKFETEQAQSRIDLLNKEKQLQEVKLKQTLQQRKFLFAGIAFLFLIGIIFVHNIQLKRRSEMHLRERIERDLQIQKLETEKTKAEFQQQVAQLEMQALRAQMNPHFIFNSLNSINRFILQNNKTQASEYLTKFSRLVRVILQNSQAALITLESELESLRLYLELESVRFDHHFEFKIEVEEDLDASTIKVPPLIIQPYAENAIWHGLMNKEEKGHLEIKLYREDNMLWCKIIDDGVGRKKATEFKDKSGKHKSMGMKITESRIAMMQKMDGGNKSVEIRDLVDADGSTAGTEVVLRIPVEQ